MYPKIVYASHHKCATKWFLNYLQSLSLRLGWKICNVDNHQFKLEDAECFCRRNRVDLLFFSNADFKPLSSLTCPIVHVVRDPRDILVSGYYSHLNSHEIRNWPELIPYREQLKSSSFSDGLMLELEFSEQFLNKMDQWPISGKNIITMRYEDFCLEPIEFVIRVLEFFEIVHDRCDLWVHNLSSLRCAINRFGRRFGGDPLIRCNKVSAMEALGLAYERRFKKIKTCNGHYRKGGAGQWIEAMEEEHLLAFQNKYGHLLELYGYV